MSELLTDTNEIILHIADLIEKGSQGRGQAIGRFFQGENVCAMGACLVAVNANRDDVTHDCNYSILQAVNVWSWPHVPYPNLNTISKPLAARDGKAPLMDVIIWLNDSQGWSFSHIVTYLRGLVTTTPEATQKTRKRQPSKKS